MITKCINCGQPIERTPEEEKGPRTPSCLCAKCAAKFSQEISQGDDDDENHVSVAGTNRKIELSQLNQPFTSWNPKTKQGTRPAE